MDGAEGGYRTMLSWGLIRCVPARQSGLCQEGEWLRKAIPVEVVSLS